jgi:RNA polymerase sigma-70 factor (ECF subfamily)
LRSRTRGTISLEEQWEATGFELAAQTDDLSGNIQQEQITRHVRRALQGLPAEMRQVIIMKEYEGLKFAEIADILGIPISTVKTRMYTGLTELRKRLEHLRAAV